MPLHDRGASDALAALDADQLHLSEIATRVPTLDDVYLNRTGAQLAGVD